MLWRTENPRLNKNRMFRGSLIGRAVVFLLLSQFRGQHFSIQRLLERLFAQLIGANVVALFMSGNRGSM
jgi:hypothetical protein